MELKLHYLKLLENKISIYIYFYFFFQVFSFLKELDIHTLYGINKANLNKNTLKNINFCFNYNKVVLQVEFQQLEENRVDNQGI